MRSKSRNAQEKAWHTTVAQFARQSGFLNQKFGGYVHDPYQFHLDHFIGAQAKRKINLKSQKVGEFAVIPVPIELHDLTGAHANHPMNRTFRKNAFETTFGSAYDIWKEMLNSMVCAGIELPFDQDLIEAVGR